MYKALLLIAMLFLLVACGQSRSNLPFTQSDNQNYEVIYSSENDPPPVSTTTESPTTPPPVEPVTTIPITFLPTEPVPIPPIETIPTTQPTPPTEPPPPRERPDLDALCNDSRSWYFVRNPNNLPPRGRESADALRPFDTFFIGDTTPPRVFLTFDSGYERGFTEAILDTLRDYDVHAAFFMTESYIRHNPEITTRKAEEGHLMANHSVTHRAMPGLTDEVNIHEILYTSAALERITGHTMSPFFRPPEGVYSERTLALTQYLGYYTVFWSFAHMDWVANDQPPPEVTFDRVISNLHNGMIILLHGVSESNTLALPYIIEAIREAGFTFGSLYELLDK